MNLGTTELLTFTRNFNSDEHSSKKIAASQKDCPSSFSDALRESSINTSKDNVIKTDSEKKSTDDSLNPNSKETVSSSDNSESVAHKNEEVKTEKKPGKEASNPISDDNKTGESDTEKTAKKTDSLNSTGSETAKEDNSTLKDTSEKTAEYSDRKTEKGFLNLSTGSEVEKYKELYREGKITVSEILKNASSQGRKDVVKPKTETSIIGRLVRFSNENGEAGGEDDADSEITVKEFKLPADSPETKQINISSGVSSEIRGDSKSKRLPNQDEPVFSEKHGVKTAKSSSRASEVKVEVPAGYKKSDGNNKKDKDIEKNLSEVTLKSDFKDPEKLQASKMTASRVVKEKKVSSEGLLKKEEKKSSYSGNSDNSMKSDKNGVQIEDNSINILYISYKTFENADVKSGNSQDLSKLKELSGLLSTLTSLRIKGNYETLQKNASNASEFWQNNKISEFKSYSDLKITVKHFIMQYTVVKENLKSGTNLEKSLLTREMVTSKSDESAKNEISSKQHGGAIISSLKKTYLSEQQTSRHVNMDDLNRMIKSENKSTQELFAKKVPETADKSSSVSDKGIKSDIKNIITEKSDKTDGYRNESGDSELVKTASQESLKISGKTVSAEDIRNNMVNISKNISELYTRMSGSTVKSESVQIQLTPPNLGKIMLEVVKEEGKISVLIRVENSDAKEILQKNSHMLANRLNAMGIETQKIQIQAQNAEDNANEEHGRENNPNNGQNSDENRKQQTEQHEENSEPDRREMSFADILKGGSE